MAMRFFKVCVFITAMYLVTTNSFFFLRIGSLLKRSRISRERRKKDCIRRRTITDSHARKGRGCNRLAKAIYLWSLQPIKTSGFADTFLRITKKITASTARAE